MIVTTNELYGGAGRCPFCDEYWGNVSYHATHDCRKNPALKEVFKQRDEELERKILGSLTSCKLTEEERFITAILAVYDQFGLALSHEDDHGAFQIVENDDYHKEWLREARRKK